MALTIRLTEEQEKMLVHIGNECGCSTHSGTIKHMIETWKQVDEDSKSLSRSIRKLQEQVVGYRSDLFAICEREYNHKHHMKIIMEKIGFNHGR